MKYIDLHTHSTASDGSYTPTELVEAAAKIGLSAIALTDHDTVDGLDEAINAAKAADIKLISGIEFSTRYYDKDIHILGLCIDYKSTAFQSQLADFMNSRLMRNEKIYALLQKQGIDITGEMMREMFKDSVPTRAHIARYLLNKGYVTSINGAFTRYIGDHSPCYVPRENITPYQTISCILEAGGVPILAHPLLYRLGKDALEKLIIDFKKMGMKGIEAIYSSHTPSDESFLRLLAGKHKLVISGGSDFHGQHHRPDVALGKGKGKLRVPSSILEQIYDIM
jgi:Predicted metal-dependent phosphoesterases (PHP family)